MEYAMMKIQQQIRIITQIDSYYMSKSKIERLNWDY